MNTIQLHLEVDWDSDGTVVGALTDGDGERVEFRGWLSFASAIEALTGHVRSAAPAPPAT